MTKRSVVAVLALTCVTFGIYAIVWLVKTKNEANEFAGADVPTAWWLLVPFANIWWQWRWSGGIEKSTRGKLSQVIVFILLALLGIIGMAIIQSKLNETIGEGLSPRAPAAP